jgi:hypothetical protein
MAALFAPCDDFRRWQMPGGKYDSSKTRVAPVFNRLRERPDAWISRLLELVHPETDSALAGLDLSFQSGHWGSNERALDPPVALLSWLVRNPTPALRFRQHIPERIALAQGDPIAVEQALKLLRTAGTRPSWHILEGPTYPDVVLETPDTLVVIEGKRTEAGPTPDTTFMQDRHQIWRHLDAAWEIRGRRRVIGFVVVEGASAAGDIPAIWSRALEEALSPHVLEESFPHRSLNERSAIARCLLGITTWQRICIEFEIPISELPDTVEE